MSVQRWLCESCLAAHKARCSMWICPGCGKETCDDCFDRYAHCKTCSAGKSDEELRLAANATNDFEFEAASPPPASLAGGDAQKDEKK